MHERREHPRYRCQLRTGVLFPDGHTELLWANDISRRGISVHADRPIRIGTHLRILVFIFNLRHGRQIPVEAMARVAGCVLDQKTTDFRLGLEILEFVGDAEALFIAEIERLSLPVATGCPDVVFSERAAAPVAESFPLHRRIKLALAGGDVLTGWTEEVTTSNMRVALARKLQTQSVHCMNIPVVLAGEPEIRSVYAKARVDSVVFRPMGDFATNFKVFDYHDNGRAILQKELRQRFPEIAQVRHDATEDVEGHDSDWDTEALPSLAALPASKPS